MALTERHREAGARLVDFAGFLMPLSYSGIIDEHHSVRRAAGLFDVSHMGQIFLTGEGAGDALQRLLTNNVAKLGDGDVLYSPICFPSGGIVDDCLAYRLSRDRFMVVANASNIAKDYSWIRDNTSSKACTIEDRSDAYGLVALQGPRAAAIWATLAGEPAAAIAPFTLCEAVAAGVSCTTSRTGYTGEDGFEILCRADETPRLWDAIREAGVPHGLKPCGLGARDTLRLEARLPLYGNDIDAETTPLEAGLGWTVKLKAGDFIGREALLEQKRSGIQRRLVCLVMRARGIARQGYKIHLPEGDGLGSEIGEITSGTKSPTLDQAIALGYVPSAHSTVGERLVVSVRGKPVAAEVVKGPFYSRGASPPG